MGSRAMPRILVVDDEPTITDTLSVILRLNGYETMPAYSGEEAVRLASEFRPDFLLSDIRMPGISGIDAALAIRDFLPQCPVLFISGHSLAEIMADGRIDRYGFEVLSKPVAPPVLLNKVAAMLASGQNSHLTIVNVDDSELPRYAVSHILRHAGFSVKEAATGEEALSLARTVPDLILLDINLPDISGFEVCRRLKSSPATAKIPIVHLTNTCRDHHSRELALSLGADDFLVHPVEPEPLVSLLRRLTAPPDMAA